MSALFDRVYFTATAGGTGNFTVSAAVPGYLTPATAGIPDGTTVTYVAESADKTQWEEGRGTYVSSGTVLQRTTVRRSSNANAAVNFSAAPRVFLDMQQEELRALHAFSHALFGGI